MNKRPNILFAIADDAGHFGLGDSSFVRTPNIKSICDRGFEFKNTFTPSPKCAPSRAALLTGRYPWQLEDAFNHWCYFPPGYKFIPDYLDEAGYFTGYTGKGWEPGDWERAGYKRNPAGNHYMEHTLTPPENSLIRSCDYAENFKSFLDERPDDSPFYFWYGCYEPHRPYSPCEGLRNGKKFDDIDYIPSYWPDSEMTKIDMLDYAFEIEWFDAHLGRMLTELERRGELDNTLIIVTTDNGCPFPRVKGQMYEQDFHLPMVGMWGNRLGKRVVVDDFIMFNDIAPTLLEAAGVEKPSEVTGNSFLYAFDATQDGFIDKERTKAFLGREQQDLGRYDDVGYPVRCLRNDQYLLAHNKFPERGPAGVEETGYTNADSSLVKEEILRQHKQGDDYYFNLSFGLRPEYELYDIIADPECMNNLADKEEFCNLLESMKKELTEFLQKTDDPAEEDPLYFDKMHLAISDGKSGLHSWKAYKEGRWEKQGY